MRGSTRIRKKHIKQAGWQIVSEGRPEPGQRYILVLRSPGGEELRIEAPTRPRAYYRAEQQILGRAGTRP
jgi:hypothetical protein